MIFFQGFRNASKEKDFNKSNIPLKDRQKVQMMVGKIRTSMLLNGLGKDCSAEFSTGFFFFAAG
jgi:hypothetical protein